MKTYPFLIVIGLLLLPATSQAETKTNDSTPAVWKTSIAFMACDQEPKCKPIATKFVGDNQNLGEGPFILSFCEAAKPVLAGIGESDKLSRCGRKALAFISTQGQPGQKAWAGRVLTQCRRAVKKAEEWKCYQKELRPLESVETTKQGVGVAK